MIALYITGGIVALVGILLFMPVRADIDYGDKFSAKIKYLFITLYDSDKPDKPSKAKKKPKKNSRKNTKAEKPTFVQKLTKKVKDDTGIDVIADDVQKGSKVGFDFEVIKLIYDSSKQPVKRLISKLKVENVSVDCIIGGDDAAVIALNYGLQSTVISGVLAWLNETVTLKVNKINVTADFEKAQTELNMKCRVRLRVISAVIFFAGYALNTAKNSNSK